MQADICTTIAGASHADRYMYNNISLKCFKAVEKLETHFTFNKFLQKIVPFMRQCGKAWQSGTCHRLQYNTARALCMPDN
jgi:hypothetical protein